MKKQFFGLALFALTCSLFSCGGNSSSTATSSTKTSDTTSTKTSTTTSSTKDSGTTSSTKTSVVDSSVTPEVKGETYTGTAYDEDSYLGGNIGIYIGDSTYTASNEKITLQYSVSVSNKAKASLDFTLSNVKLISNTGNDFSDKCTTKFNGSTYSEDTKVTVSAGKSVKISFSASFNDEAHDGNTAYRNTFTLKDSQNNIYNISTSPSDETYFYEVENVEIYENSECTASNNFKFVTTGSGAYDEESYSYSCTDVMTVTNTGSDTKCVFAFGSVAMSSIADESECYYDFLNSKIDDESLYSFYDAEDFKANSVLTIDFSKCSNYILFSQGDFPVKVTFKIADTTNKKNLQITYYMTAKAN